TEVDGAEALLVDDALPLADHAVAAVVDDHRLHGQPLLEAGGELLAVHGERAVAIDVDHELARIARLHSHGRGQAIAHGAETTSGAPHARVLEAVVLGRPHLVLPHPGDHEGLAVGEVGDLLDHVLRLDDLVGPLVAKGLIALPTRDLLGPLSPRLPHRPR